MPKFYIDESISYRVEADSPQEAIDKYLKGPNGVEGVEFTGVHSRTIDIDEDSVEDPSEYWDALNSCGYPGPAGHR